LSAHVAVGEHLVELVQFADAAEAIAKRGDDATHIAWANLVAVEGVGARHFDTTR
jgi:hypothetical protein